MGGDVVECPPGTLRCDVGCPLTGLGRLGHHATSRGAAAGIVRRFPSRTVSAGDRTGRTGALDRWVRSTEDSGEASGRPARDDGPLGRGDRACGWGRRRCRDGRSRTTGRQRSGWFDDEKFLRSGAEMRPHRVAEWTIAGSALVVVFCAIPTWPVRAEHSDSVPPACGPSCDARAGRVDDAALRPPRRGGAARAPTDGPSARKIRAAQAIPSDAGEFKAPQPSAQPTIQPSSDRARRLDAARRAETTDDSFVRTEANTGAPLLPARGIPIPTVHIGVLPRPDGQRRAGSPGSFEVPGESAADALRRKILMHICATC